jgi:hypothetical protein
MPNKFSKSLTVWVGLIFPIRPMKTPRLFLLQVLGMKTWSSMAMKEQRIRFGKQSGEWNTSAGAARPSISGLFEKLHSSFMKALGWPNAWPG